MAINIEDALLFSIAQKGKRYVFGAEVPATTSDKWDCSELVEVACRSAGIKPTVPDGAFFQWKRCKDHKLLIPVSKGVRTRGALLFVGDGIGVGRDAITHVAWSIGDGTTVEARGKRWGVGGFPTAGRFAFAGLIPGVSYGKAKVPPVQQPGGRPVLRHGDGTPARPNPHVDFVQTVMRKRGMRGDNGRLIVDDGEFGDNTSRAVIDLKRFFFRMTDPDDIIGPRMWTLIDQLARA